MTNIAVIGSTGFVGSHILSYVPMAAQFNSSNIEALSGKRFETIYCAGISGVKWWANQNPEEDRARIANLFNVLESVKADRFVLISTVDVLGDEPSGDENAQPPMKQLNAYGRNRMEAELKARKLFDSCYVVRLPGLFGARLRKNLIYDLMHQRRLESIPRSGQMQWYPLDHIGEDLKRVMSGDFATVHLVTEPIPTTKLLDEVFNEVHLPPWTGDIHPHYDVTTSHAEDLGGSHGYILDQEAVIGLLRDFVSTNQNNSDGLFY